MINVTSIEINKPGFNVTWHQWYEGLFAQVIPLNATCKGVKWTSSNTSVATVNSSTGKVYGVEEGEATIYATALDGTGVRASCRVNVVPPATSIRFPRTREFICKNETLTFSNILRPSGSVDNITWSSSDSSIASVNNGTITGHNVGTATITARALEVSASVLISVVEKKVVICKDNNNDFERQYNKIIFGTPGESDYKEWLCVDELLLEPLGVMENFGNSITDGSKDERMDRNCKNVYVTYNLENPLHTGLHQGEGIKTYSDDELKIIYAIDPYGMSAYVQSYAFITNDSTEDIVECKNTFFNRIFGRAPNIYKRNSIGNWYIDNSQSYDIDDVISESEFIFGAHMVYDAVTYQAFLNIVADCIDATIEFFIKNDTWKTVLNFVIAYPFRIYFTDTFFTWDNIESNFTSDMLSLEDCVLSRSLKWVDSIMSISGSFDDFLATFSDEPDYYKDALSLCSSSVDDTFKNYAIFFKFNDQETCSAYELLSGIE